MLVTHLDQMIAMFEGEDTVTIQKTAKKDGFRFTE